MSAKPRILIDARKLGDGGIGLYTDNLVSGLLQNGSCEISVVVRPEIELKKKSFAGAISVPDWWSEVEKIEDAATPYSVDEYLSMAKRLPQERFDLYHAPHFTLPFGLKIPAIVTVHDLIHIKIPERPFYPFVAKRLIRSAVKRAAAVVTVSQSTSQDLLELMGNRPTHSEKITVIPNALNPTLLAEELESEEFFRGLNLNAPFLFAVISTLKPHKGLADLVAAFTKVRSWAEDQGRPLSDLRLVLAGHGAAALPDSSQLFEKCSMLAGVHMLGPIKQHLLANLYSRALAVVVPSLAEGFCFPVLEAHAFGRTAIVRPVPAILELVNQQDSIAKDFTVDALIEAIKRPLEQFKEQPTLCRTIRKTTTPEQYTLESVTERVLEVYSKVLSRTGAERQLVQSAVLGGPAGLEQSNRRDSGDDLKARMAV